MLRISDFHVAGIFVYMQCYILGMSPKSKHGIQLHFPQTLYTHLIPAHLIHITYFRFAQPKVSFIHLCVVCASHARSGREFGLAVWPIYMCFRGINLFYIYISIYECSQWSEWEGEAKCCPWRTESMNKECCQKTRANGFSIPSVPSWSVAFPFWCSTTPDRGWE